MNTAKTVSSESLGFHPAYFYAQMTGAGWLACVSQKVNLNEKSVQIDSIILLVFNALRVGFLPFTLTFDHLINNLKKVN